MSGSSGQPRIWSIWIYDRHCTLIFHADWSFLHNRAVGASTNQTGWDGAGAVNGKAGAGGGGRSSILPLAEQAKLVYGLVFSLRNMTRKLSPQSSTSDSTSSSSKETLHSFSTSTYTLAHLQTLTNYTFVMITDPVQAPTRRAPQTTTGSTFGSGSSSTFSGGGGIPATGGMTTTGVLAQISRGPWVEFVARNPACLSLERESDEEDDDQEEESIENGEKDETAIQERNERLNQRRILKQKEIQKQRLTGIGKSVDSEAFRAAIERVLAQNKLNAPRM